MSSYTARDGTALLFPVISDAALVNVTPATFFDKLMQSNPNAYRSLTRSVVTCIFILMGLSRRLTESPQSNVRIQAQDMVKRWEASEEWKVLGSIMKNNPQPAQTPPYNGSNNPSFQFDSKIFTLPRPNEKLFNRGDLDNARFSKAFAKQNVHQAVSKRIISAAVGYFAVHYFPDTAAKIFISFNDQSCLPKRPFYLENDQNRSGILEMNLPNERVSTPAIATSLTCNGRISDNQTKANKIPKDISANAHRKTHVSQRLGLLQPTHLEDTASRRSSILVSLPSNVAIGATINIHVHSVREKRSNGTVLYQIEVVAPHGPSLILTCKNDFHRDYVFRRLSDRNMNHGSQTAVALSMERAENNDASANAQWYLPIEFDDSVSAIFETLRNSFRNTGMIPGKDLIERVLVIHAGSDLWLKKYAMTSKGFTKRLLHAELAGSHEECCICQEVIQGHQSFLTGHTSNQAGELTKNVTPSPKGPSPLTQVPHREGKSWPASPDTKTALDTSNFPDRPAAQSTEEGDVFVPWQVPAAHSSSLAEVTISQFVADFAELNGRERACAATGRDIVSAFNGHIDTNFPGSSYEEKVSALRRKYYGVLSTSFHPNFRALENNRALMLGKVNPCNLLSGTTVPLTSEPVGEDSNVKDQTARDQNLRRRRYRAKQKEDALDPATPGILMILGQIKNVVESRGFEEVDGAYEEPESYRRLQEKSKAEVEEAHSRSTKGVSGRKRRSRTKRKNKLPLNNLVPQVTDAHETAPRQSQKTVHGQSSSDSIEPKGEDNSMQGSGSSSLSIVDNFLFKLGEELDAKAARKIRFSAHPN